MKKVLAFVTVAVLLLGLFAVPGFAAEYDNKYVKDGLVALYDGTFNTRNGQDLSTDVWEDLSGNGLDIEGIELGDNIYWEADGLHVSACKIILPTELVDDVIDTDEYTVEYFIKDLEVTGTSFATFINSTNDNFALFIRNSDGNIEFKNATNPRPKAGKGVELVNGHTLAVTHKTGGDICIAIDGSILSTTKSSVETNANTPFFIGHDNASKSYNATIVGLRFYNRVLSADELKANAEVAAGGAVEEITYDYKVHSSSLDSVKFNDILNFGEGDGNGSAKLDNHDRTIDGSDGSISSIEVKGWVGFDGDQIDQLGYKVGDQVFYGDFKTPTDDAVINAGGPDATRFVIVVDTTGLTGRNLIVPVVKLASGVVVNMDGVELENALGKVIDMSFTYVGPEGTAPQTGEQPTTEVPQTEVPQTGDMSVVMFALVLFLAISAAVLLKKRAF
ncbi:MAG: hypothetical protein J6X19_00490 [Clostridia bacterium]|nr:hypothetical protein [Clostridia bacterium]